jgi:UDP-N-acetyl-D-galactosamine dehydrogenase
VTEPIIAVVGLGYVGLPLAVGFADRYDTLGFDIDCERAEELRLGHDRTLEVSERELAGATRLTFTSDSADLSSASVFVITVPTPVDRHKRPDLTPLESASRMVGRAMQPGALVIYESTVYPGATEEVCVPILEAESGLVFNEDFTVGYSPERINPGDKERRLATIVKVTSGSTAEAAEVVDSLYRSIIPAGTFKASSIKVAEAAKVIENTQRDVNIALINELSLLFGKLGIDTSDVLAAAGTKWNFLGFRPGLVGGHCIGVDPYYLTHKAEEVGYHPQVILAGRRINDGMGGYVAEQVVRLLAKRGRASGTARVLVLGLSFKENVPDLRNTRVVDLVGRLEDYGATVDVTDPWVDPVEAKQEYGIDLVNVDVVAADYDAAIVTVAHSQFLEIGERLRALLGEGGVLFDVTGRMPQHLVDARL